MQSFTQIIFDSSEEIPSSAHLSSRPGKHPLSAHPVTTAGVTPTFRVLQSRPRKHPLSAHLTQPLYVAAAGIREPPELPAWHWEIPYTTITVFPAVHIPGTSLYPARSGIPLWL